MDHPRADVIVASTLYLVSAITLDPSPCPCRVRAVVAHLERLMEMDGVDPVLRATAIALHEHWLRVAAKIADAARIDAADGHPPPTWH